jgi:hypothetical protein
VVNVTGDRGISRFSYMEVPYMHGFFDRAGPAGGSRISLLPALVADAVTV